jgi:hypothetical protein
MLSLARGRRGECESVTESGLVGEPARFAREYSALVSAGIAGGYLANPRMKRVQWQAGDRAAPPPQTSTAGESPLYVEPSALGCLWPANLHGLGATARGRGMRGPGRGPGGARRFRAVRAGSAGCWQRGF